MNEREALVRSNQPRETWMLNREAVFTPFKR